MKIIKVIMLACVSTVLAAPVFAQVQKNPLGVKEFYKLQMYAAIERAVMEEAAKSKAAKCKDICQNCKEKVQPGKHCPATDYTATCTSSCAANTDSASAQEMPACCPKCHKPYTIDERYHGVQHHCDSTNQSVAKPVCCRCGQEIHPYQHCSATDYTDLCTPQEQSSDSSDSKTQMIPCCPDCLKAYTIDEQFHGKKHKCPAKKKTAKRAKDYCIYCGEEIVQSNQHCSSGKETFCTVRCPECALDLRNPDNLTPNGVHYCKFKFTIKPALPKTKK